MKGYYIKTSERTIPKKEWIYKCNDALFNSCTLFRSGEKGLAVIQQRFNSDLKISWWGPIDPWLVDDIFGLPEFEKYLAKYADYPDDGIFPVVEIRKLMYALGMKPMKKQFWETGFRK